MAVFSVFIVPIVGIICVTAIIITVLAFKHREAMERIRCRSSEQVMDKEYNNHTVDLTQKGYRSN